MGTCTSTARQQQKQLRQQQHSRGATKNSFVLDTPSPPPLPPIPLNVFPKHCHPSSFLTSLDLLIPSLSKSILHSADTNSLIQLYSSNTNNNNNSNNLNSSNSHINWMSSSTSIPASIPPRIPVLKARVPLGHPPQAPSSLSKPTNVTSTVISNHQTGFSRPMSSITNRPPPPTTMQTRFGFIPRPTGPGAQHLQTSTFAARSRSISPTSTMSANSSSSSSIASQRLSKTQTISKATPTRSVPTKPVVNGSTTKIISSPRQRESSLSRVNGNSTLQTSTAASRMRSRTPSSSLSITSPSSTAPLYPSTTKADLNAVRDRYKSQQRMNFFSRHTPISTANGSPMASSIKSPELLPTEQDKRQPFLLKAPLSDSKSLTPPKAPSTSHVDCMPRNLKSVSNHSPSAHLSQGNRHRQRAVSLLSATSAISDVLNQDALLDDDNCSLKSDDLMCDYDDTLTMDSVSKNDRTDSCSSASFTVDLSKKPNTVVKANVPKSISKENRPAGPPGGKHTPVTNGSLRESLDELNRLSHRVENTIDNEQNRKLTGRAVSLKPPPNYLPPLDDAEQIGMDIESYRQVMKDVMVVKTILHQLDRLLKHSDGANMTDSMICSFHEFHDSMIHSRRCSFSTIGDGLMRQSIDENSSYDDLLKEILTLRKEREQDKQTIKLLQEQMYKYSSQTNGG